MLLTEEVKMKVNAKNIHWYRSKGYKCIQGDIITVKLKDLSNGTHTKIKYKCDKCGEAIELAFSSFILRHELEESHFCTKCANELLLEEKHGKYQAKNGLKLCKKCNRIFPANTDYYFQRNDTVDGFVTSCKECNGHEFTDKLTKIPKDGFKFCSKCGSELPVSSKYFEKNKEYKDGLRGVCRECMGDHYREEETFKSDNWSKEDLELLKSVYHDYTGEELVNKFFPNRTVRSLECQADNYNFAWKTKEAKERSYKQQAKKLSHKLKGKKLSKEHCLKISKIKQEYYKTHDSWMLGRTLSDKHRQIISDRNTRLGKWKGENNPRYKNPLSGELNPNWKGGITGLYYELRSDTKEWQEESMKFCNYKCIITNGYFDNVHHLMPFRDIIDETFINCNLDKRSQVLDYTDEEFVMIRSELKSLHNKYGYGVCLCKDIHKLFHDNYGYMNNTVYQFLDFVYRLDVGEFDEWSTENNVKLNINYQIIDYLESSLVLQQTA